MFSYGSIFSILVLHLLRSAVSSGSYDSFRDEHGRAALQEHADRYAVRHDLFHRRKAEMLTHNSRNSSWKMVLNRFSDFTDTELKARLGYKRTGSRHSAPSGGSSLLQETEYGVGIGGQMQKIHKIDEKLKSDVDWRANLQKSSGWVRDQGSCGSCWAVAAVGALEMHAEKAHGFAKQLSHQQLVDCVSNPRHCGGTGGCKGATGEQAFEFARTNGISLDSAYSTGNSGACNTKAPTAFKVASFVRLPENSVTHLLHAVATKGPVVVSVDGSNWFSYGGGVFHGCDADTVVNHAVLALGYGTDPVAKKTYWTIRNSWGGEWGEQGFMRIERHANDKDYCGEDNKPKDGVGCDGAPDKITVCGMCGITSDSAYPSVSAPTGLRHRASKAFQRFGL